MLSPIRYEEFNLNSKDIIDINKLKTYISNYYNVIKDYITDENLSFSIPKDISEYWIKKSIYLNNVKKTGKGNFCVDILYDNIAIDVKCMICNKCSSNETSLIQNFKTIGNKLDERFDDIKEFIEETEHNINYNYQVLKIQRVYKLFKQRKFQKNT